MNFFLKTTTIGAVVCGAFSANALPVEATILGQHVKNLPVKTNQWQESLVVDSFYQGDFQQLWRPLQRNQETEKLYTGANSVAVPSGILSFL